MTACSSAPPEILLQVSEYFDRHSLAACLTVCQRWYQLLLPQRWKVVLTQDWASPALRDRLEAHIHHVQHLEWCEWRGVARHTSYSQSHRFATFYSIARGRQLESQWSRSQTLPPLSDSIGDQYTMATLLERLGSSGGSSGHDSETDKDLYSDATDSAGRLKSLCIALDEGGQIQLAKTIASLRHLQRLVLIMRSWDASPASAQDWLELRQAWLTIYSTVEELYIWNLDQRTHESVVTLESRPPSEYDLSSSWSMSVSEQEHIERQYELAKPHHRDSRFFPPGWEDAQFPNLKVLFLGNVRISPETFLRLMARCPNLRSTLWPYFEKVPTPSTAEHNSSMTIHHYVNNPEFWERMPAHTKDKLEHLWLGRLDPAETKGLLFSHLHNIRRINMQCVQIEDEHLALLVQESPAIEDVDISCCSRLSSQAVWAFFSRASKLKRFEADCITLQLPKALLDRVAHQSSADNSHDHKGAQEQDTEVLHLACRDLEVLMIGFNVALGSTVGSKAMFALLCQFTKLRYLRLSNQTCMVPSEAGGLYQLATLRRLKYFILDGAVYGELSRDSVHWMMNSWPRLKRLHLGRQSIYQVKAIEEWAEECGRAGVVVLESSHGFC